MKSAMAKTLLLAVGWVALLMAGCSRPASDTAAALIDQGVKLELQGRGVEAMECYHQAATLADSTDFSTKARANLHMAVLYTNSYAANNEDIDKYRIALACYERLADTTQIINCLRNIGAQYRKSNVDSASHYLSRAVHLLAGRGDTVGQSEALEGLARAHYVDGNYRLAQQMALMSIHTCTPAPEAAYCDAAMALARMGKADSAQWMLNQAATVVPSLANEALRLVAEREIALSRGDYKQVHLLGERVAALNDSVTNARLRQQLVETERRLDRNREQLRLAQAERRNTLLWMVIGLLLLLLAAAVAYYLRRRRQVMEERMELMERLQLEGATKADTVLDAVSDESQLKVILSRQIENIRSLIDLSYKFSERPERFMEQFKTRIEQGRLPDGFWGNLRYFVDAQYNNVITRLQRQHPSLTDDELYIIGLLCCGFTYADITVCMGYTNINYVNTKKSRIAKKMGLNEPLSQFLASYVATAE